MEEIEDMKKAGVIDTQVLPGGGVVPEWRDVDLMQWQDVDLMEWGDVEGEEWADIPAVF